MRPALACLLALLLVPAPGCDDEQSDAPPPPSSGGAASGAISTDGGTRPPPRPDDEDGGPGEPGDAGESDSGMLPQECQNVDVVQVPAEELPPGTEASTTSPADFRVSRLVGTWQGGCEDPVFRIEMSDGACPNGGDHALVFAIEAGSLRDGSLRLGLNSITAEPNELGVAIRYVRPAPLASEGEWGTCAGASGSIDLLGEPPSTARSALQARFTLELTACDDSGASPQAVDGTFDVMLRRGLADYCPDM